MNNKVIIATTYKGLARAECDTNGGWSVVSLLEDAQPTCLVTDPHCSDVVYAGTRDRGVLRSEDRGKTWQPAGMDGQVVKSIALSRSESGVMYAGTKPPALFVTRDDGQNWVELELFRRQRRRHWSTPAEPGDPYVLGLDVSPTDPNNIIAGVEFGATMHSTDGGKTWSRHLKGTSRDCHSLIFHITDGNWAYQAGGGWPAAFSRDGGRTWHQPRRGMGWSFYAMAVAADPERPDIWYVSAAPFLKLPDFKMRPHWDGHASGSIFRRDEGRRWKRLSGGLPQPLDYMAYALVTDPSAPGHVYAGVSNGDVWHTADYGDNWRKLPINLESVFFRMIVL